MSMVNQYQKIPMPRSTQAPPWISTSLVTGLPTPTRHSTPPPSAREYLQAGAALPCSLLMATIPVCTPEDTLQHPLTPPTFPPPTITRTQSLLQPQPLQGLWIIIPPLVCHSLLKLLLLPGSKGSKPMPNNVTKSSTAPPSVPHQQEELNVASSILRNLNPTGGLFDQLAAHTLALSACPQANSVPSAFRTWDQPTISKLHSQRLPPCINNNNWTLSYIDKPGNPTNEHTPCNGPP
ncbi:hypothetical protein C0989_001736 [Termitomyces sp. Mn162]|nr:hypothetical protein C0989_001736 [Termitomyces sp. Mn162]